MGTEEEEEDEDDDNEEVILPSSKLQPVLAAKSRKLQYTSSPIVSEHVSLSLLSSPDDSSSHSHSRASVPFSWEEEPGKPKHHFLLPPPPPCSTCLHLPPRLLPPAAGFTKMSLASDHRPHHHHHHHLAGLMKRWFRGKKEKPDDHDVARKGIFVSPSEYGDDDTKITRTRGLHCLSDDVTSCYFWELTWKGKRLKKDDL